MIRWRPARRRLGQAQRRVALQQPGEGDLAFEPRERRAEAVVNAGAEAELRVRHPPDVEALRLGEHRRVAIGRAES